MICFVCEIRSWCEKKRRGKFQENFIKLWARSYLFDLTCSTCFFVVVNNSEMFFFSNCIFDAIQKLIICMVYVCFILEKSAYNNHVKDFWSNSSALIESAHCTTNTKKYIKTVNNFLFLLRTLYCSHNHT